MPILISRCYEVITHESAENNEFADRGYVYDDKPMTFRELVRELREFNEMSSWQCDFESAKFAWASQSEGSVDYYTGEERRETLHFSKNNDKRYQRYWALACKAAGLLGKI